MGVLERILLRVVRRVRVRALLGQIQLAVDVEVVHLLQGHALLSFFGVGVVVVAAALAVGTLLLDYELLA